MATMRPYAEGDVDRVRRGLQHLGKARELFKRADCPRALARVRRALYSAEGALRHVQHRRARASFTVGRALR